MIAGINVVVVDLAVVVSLYLLVLEVVVWCGVVRCNYDIVVVLMIMLMVDWRWRWCMCHVILNLIENKLKPRLLLIFLPDRICLCRLGITTTIHRLIL